MTTIMITIETGTTTIATTDAQKKTAPPRALPAGL